MTTTYSISDAKKQLGKIGSQLTKGNKASILKNGKPFLYIISPHEISDYEQFLEKKKKEQWDSSLHWEEVSLKSQVSIADAKKEDSLAITKEQVFEYINS